MKKIVLLLSVLMGPVVQAQTTMDIHKTDGTVLSIPVTEIDSVTYTIAAPPIFTVGAGVNDIDGNSYPSVVLGTQEWMAQNLNTAHYANGDSIAFVQDNNTWSTRTTGAWCYYNNDPQYDSSYGKLYNWYTTIDPRNVCPAGWHVPSDNEWSTLLSYLGGASSAGSKMREAGLAHWTAPNNADNTSGFTGLPGGYRMNTGTFANMGDYGYWWSNVEYNPGAGYYCSLYYNSALARLTFNYDPHGLSIRCVKN